MKLGCKSLIAVLFWHVSGETCDLGAYDFSLNNALKLIDPLNPRQGRKVPQSGTCYVRRDGHT